MRHREATGKVRTGTADYNASVLLGTPTQLYTIIIIISINSLQS
jgi:hypothetical protein